MNKRSRAGWGVLTVLFVGVLAVGLALWHNGYRAFVIHTGSMQPTASPGDLIIDRPASGEYHPGDIITFRHSAGPDLVTHRITDVTVGKIHTKGDANPTADVWDIPPSMVLGSVQWRIPAVGYLIVYLQQPAGFGSLLTVTVGLTLLWGLFLPAVATAAGSTSRISQVSG